MDSLDRIFSTFAFGAAFVSLGLGAFVCLVIGVRPTAAVAGTMTIGVFAAAMRCAMALSYRAGMRASGRRREGSVEGAGSGAA